jgi:hypothetical protein
MYVLFHAGIFADGREGTYCRPVFYEVIRQVPGLKAQLAHLGWPWVDECIAVLSMETLAGGDDPRKWQLKADLSFGMPADWQLGSWQRAVDSLPAAMLCYGSDVFWPCDPEQYREQYLQPQLALFEVALTRGHLAGEGSDERKKLREQIFYENAWAHWQAAIGEPQRPRAGTRHPLRDMQQGAAFVIRHELLRPILITQFIFNAALFVIQAVYVPYAIRALGLSPAGVGITLGAFGAGMVLGALSAARIMGALAPGTVIAIGPLAGLAAALMMMSTIWLPSPALAGSSFFLMGAGPILWVVSTTTLRQTVTPPDLLGRVSAINSMAYGARPLGAGIGALVGGLMGAEACLVVAAVGFAAQAVVILVSPAVRLRGIR